MTEHENRPPVLVFGSGITTLGVIRSLGRLGIPVFCATDNVDFIKCSRYFSSLTTFLSSSADSAQLEHFLVQLHVEQAVLLPCSDNWLQKVCALSPTSSKRFLHSPASSEVVDIFIDKGTFARQLDELAIAHPVTYLLSSQADLLAVPQSIYANAFLKPRHSQDFFKRYNVKALRVASLQDAQHKYDELTAAGFSLVLQEYIPGPPSNHYFIDGYIDLSGECSALFARRRLRMFPEDFGNSSYMKSVALDSVAPAVKTVVSLLTTLNYRGIFSAEFKVDSRDNTFRILEVNTRPWWFIEFASRCGVNVAQLLYHDLLGEKITPVTSYKTGVYCVNLYYDYHACLALFKAHKLRSSLQPISWITAQQTAFCWDDMGPTFAWFKSLIFNRLDRLANNNYPPEKHRELDEG